MTMTLRGRVAVVTGASAGIGLAITEALAAEGAYVVAGARHSSPGLDALAAGGHVGIHEVDLATTEGPAGLVAVAARPVDVLVNNVGLSVPRPGGFLAIGDRDWAGSFTLNLMAAVRATRAVLPGMLTAGGGAIITIGSVNAWLPDPLIADYCAAKAALWSFTKALSMEFGPRGVRVNLVAPGPTATRRWPVDQRAAVVARTVTGHLSEPGEIAAVVVMLAGGHVGNIAGTAISVDGGLVPTL